jgi:hypothetical protein
MEGESQPLDKETKIKLVKVLARAAYDEDFYQKLSTDTTGTLNAEGIQGQFNNISDGKLLKGLVCIIECLGGIIEKRS